MSFSTPVDVSACTTATTRACGCSRCASSRRCGSSGSPHSASTRTTSAPQRRATSHMRSPNTPLTPTIAVSPGSSRLTKHASMPAEPVPLIGSVSAFVGAEHGAQARHRLVEHREELGIEVPEHRAPERGDRLGVRVRRTGPEQQAIGDRASRGAYAGTVGRGCRVGGVRRGRAPGTSAASSWLHLGRDAVAGDEAARDLGRGARDVRDVGVGKLHAVAIRRRAARSARRPTRRAPPAGCGASGGARGRSRWSRATRRPRRPRCRLASERAMRWMSSDGELRRERRRTPSRSMTRILGTNEHRVGGFPGSGPQISVNCVFPRSRRRLGASRLAAHQAVEDVGLARRASRRSRAPAASPTSTIAPPTITSTRPGSRPGLCARCAARLGRERAEHVLGRGARQAEVVDALGVVLGRARARSRRSS